MLKLVNKIKSWLISLYSNHREFWDKQRLSFLLEAFGFFAFALLVQHFADVYVNRLTGVAVGDIILSNIPTVDIDFLIIQGALVLTAIVILLLLVKPKYIPFSIKALSVFVIIRSISISLTHLGVDPHELVYDTHSFGYGLYNLFFNSRNDFFFSGHTSTPFLMALIFWREKIWRYLFFVISAIFGISVLLAHIHYSIDVFAAPFMTYSIFKLSQWLFPKDYALLAGADK